MLAEQIARHEAAPADDRIILLHDARWSDYQRLLEVRGDRPVPRLAYVEGVLELMTPSREHEFIKSMIGCLVEAWCSEHGVEFSPVGSWTLEDKDAERGVEPDECYVFGGRTEPERPDLAIEVIWTSGGVDKRRIYAKLGVRELWFWERGHIDVHVLRGEQYAKVEASEVLPRIDLAELAGFIDRPTASQAIREYRAALQRRS